jgi:hypothetical protein
LIKLHGWLLCSIELKQSLLAQFLSLFVEKKRGLRENSNRVHFQCESPRLCGIEFK